MAVYGSRCIVADLHLQRRGGGGGGDHLDAEVRGGSVKKNFRPFGLQFNPKPWGGCPPGSLA